MYVVDVVVLSSPSIPVTAELSAPDALDLQVEYWTIASRTEPTVEKVERLSRKEMKCSLKMSLHSLRVFRCPAATSSSTAAAAATAVGDAASLLAMVTVTLEKKQKSVYHCKLWFGAGFFSSFAVILISCYYLCPGEQSEHWMRLRDLLFCPSVCASVCLCTCSLRHHITPHTMVWVL